MRDDQLYFFVGIPGSSWSRVANLLHRSPKFNLNDSDRSPEREFYGDHGSHTDFAMHQGVYFDPGMEFGEGFNAAGDHYTKDTFKKEISKAWKEHDDRNYLVKSHSLSTSLEWIDMTFPESPIILVVKPVKEALVWWTRARGFAIPYPDYRWYRDDLYGKVEEQDRHIRRFVRDRDCMLYGMTDSLFKDKLGVDLLRDEEARRNLLAIQGLTPDGRGNPKLDNTMVAFYKVPGVD